MSLGIGIDCKRCGQQLSYEHPNFDKDRELCGKCVSIVDYEKEDL